jgi:hypothetical protein
MTVAEANELGTARAPPRVEQERRAVPLREPLPQCDGPDVLQLEYAHRCRRRDRHPDYRDLQGLGGAQGRKLCACGRDHEVGVETRHPVRGLRQPIPGIERGGRGSARHRERARQRVRALRQYRDDSGGRSRTESPQASRGPSDERE